MKNLFFLLVAPIFILGLLSCEKQNDSFVSDEVLIESLQLSEEASAIGLSDLPEAVYQTLDESYFYTVLEQAFYVPGTGYELFTNDGDVLYFNDEGMQLHPRHRRICMIVFKRGTEIDIEETPDSVQVFIENKFPNREIKTVRELGDRGYAVLLEGGLLILFNADGTKKRPVHCAKPNKPNLHLIPLDALPDKIQNYIDAEYPGVKFVKIAKTEIGFLVLLNNNGVRCLLVFDKQGLLRESKGC